MLGAGGGEQRGEGNSHNLTSTFSVVGGKCLGRVLSKRYFWKLRDHRHEGTFLEGGGRSLWGSKG